MYYEAARIDGASALTQFRHITLPLLKPATFLLLVLSVIYSFHVFDLIYVMTGGGPGFSTTMLVQYIFRSAFVTSEMGYACAVGIALCADPWLHHPAMARKPAGREREVAMATRRYFADSACWLGLVAGAAVMLFPIYWMFATAVRPHAEIFEAIARLVPSSLSWSNFHTVLTRYPVLTW